MLLYYWWRLISAFSAGYIVKPLGGNKQLSLRIIIYSTDSFKNETTDCMAVSEIAPNTL